MAVFNPQQLQQLQEQAISARGKFSQSQLNQLQQQLDCDLSTLLQALVPVAACFSQAPVSNFNVGAVAYDSSTGCAYLGANLEFSHQALSLVVHAEQSAINNAWLNGAKQISMIAISDAPCGYCRQFMYELDRAGEMNILLPDLDTNLSTLLPSAFGPQDLDNSERLLASKTIQVIKTSKPISDALYSHVRCAYAPYSENFSAVEVVTREQGTFYGRYAENAAYSPSLSPMQSALSQLALAGLTIADVKIEALTLVETQGRENQKHVAEAVLASYGDAVALNHVTATIEKVK